MVPLLAPTELCPFPIPSFAIGDGMVAIRDLAKRHDLLDWCSTSRHTVPAAQVQ